METATIAISAPARPATKLTMKEGSQRVNEPCARRAGLGFAVTEFRAPTSRYQRYPRFNSDLRNEPNSKLRYLRPVAGNTFFGNPTEIMKKVRENVLSTISGRGRRGKKLPMKTWVNVEGASQTSPHCTPFFGGMGLGDPLAVRAETIKDSSLQFFFQTKPGRLCASASRRFNNLKPETRTRNRRGHRRIELNRS